MPVSHKMQNSFWPDFGYTVKLKILIQDQLQESTNICCFPIAIYLVTEQSQKHNSYFHKLYVDRKMNTRKSNIII